jgi:glycosyltransferase involved in cell wall biosynthesis
MALIAIDMTPLLAGGENGGVKPLAMELIRGFQAISQNDSFLLLTASWNDEELSSFDSATTRRLLILDKQGRIMHGNSRFIIPIERILRKIYREIRRHYREKLLGKGLLSQRGVDVLFCPFTAPTFAEPGIPVVSLVCDLQHKDYPQFFKPGEVAAREALFSEVRRRADAIICISENTRQAVIRHLGVNPDKTCTIHISIQSRLAGRDMLKNSEQLRGLQIADHPFMYYPANFWLHKNHKLLINAYGIFVSRHPDCKMDLVFTGALDDAQRDLQGDVRRMGLERRVHFLGYLPEAQLIAVWEGCSFLIFPSLYEGFGIPVLEAMQFGKPVLCSNVASLPEIAGDAALYFDPLKTEDIVQCIERIVEDQELFASLVRRGYERLANFQPGEMVKKYLQCLDGVVKRPGQLHGNH